MIPLRGLADLVRGDLADADELADLVAGDGLDGDLEAFYGVGVSMSRIRPLLVALSARAAGAGQVDPHLQHAAEVLHLAVVTHDLAFGRSGGRRRRVAKRLFNSSAGRLDSHHLTLRALELARNTPSPEILGELLDTLREVVGAQALSRELRRGPSPTHDDWIEHVDGHTGAIFAFCCRAGALLGHAEPAVQSALGRFGRHTGRVWSVAEDLSALSGPEAGAHLLDRLAAGRPMLPVVEAVRVDPAFARRVDALIARPRGAVADELAQEVVRLGGAARARAVMARDSWAARRALRGVPESRYRDGLERLAKELVQRR